MYATNEYCLVGKGIPQKHLEIIEKVLKVPIHMIHMAGTSMIGVFVAGNKNCLLVPETAYDDELEVLKKLNINFEVINTKLTALGNNILCNDNGALISTEFSDEARDAIKTALKVEVIKTEIAEMEAIGAIGSMNAKGMIIHEEASDKEIELLEKTFDIKVFKGTVNLGNPYISSGLVTNDNGFIMGEMTSGPEAVDIDDNLGFLG